MNNNMNHVRRYESDPEAVRELGEKMLEAVRAGKVSGAPGRMVAALKEYSRQAEKLGLDVLARDLWYEATVLAG